MIPTLYTKLKKLKVNIQLVDGHLDLEAPKGVLNKELLNEIKSQKDDLINFIISYKNNDKGYSSINTVMSGKSYPLSSSQRRLWILSQFEGSNVAYNMPGVYVFEGAFDRTAFTDSFHDLLERHESLRTVFKEDEEGNIGQYILTPDESGFQVVYHDLRQEAGREEMVKEQVLAAAVKTFDLSEGPLIRAELYQTEDQKWVFGYVMHHIISDGWSMGILIRELLQLYNARISGETPYLRPLRIQYKDYAAWQQEQLSGEALKEHRTYWLKQFAGQLPVLELPADHVRPAVQTYNGGGVNRLVSAAVARNFNLLCQEQGATLFMGLVAAVNLLLHRYTGQEDIIVGSPVTGRDHMDLEDQIGFYVNTLVLRTRFSADDSYRTLLDNVREIMLGAYQHQVYPFDELVDTLQLERDLSRNPLFDVMVTMENTDTNPSGKQTLGDLKVSKYEKPDDRVSKFDLSFDFAQAGELLVVGIGYNRDIYSERTAGQLADHLSQLLGVVAFNADAAIGTLEFISPEEKHQLVQVFNDTAVAYDTEKTVINLFEEQVALTPDNTAVVFDDVTLSYAELNERANQLGDYLRKKYSIVPDDLVGIRLEHSEWMIVAIYGVLKSGAAYLPIDPEYPEDRISYMITDSRCKVLLDEAELAIFISERAQYTSNNLPSVNRVSDLAYVIYTSGTTGNPKGVMIEHGSLYPRILFLIHHYHLSAADNFIFYRSFSFDAAIEDYLLPGMIGATCHVTPVGFNRDIVNNIIHFVAEHQITKINMPPILLGELLLQPDIATQLSSLQHVVSDGDKMTFHLVNDFLSRFNARLYNGYGPTENTNDSTNWVAEKHHSNMYVPIGKPIENSQAYILDSRQQVVPVGVYGELYVSGVGLSRGYLNNPALTAERFVANPFRPGERMYKTGDWCRWLPDGNIEFNGRRDFQVKIRGYRIELGEIEIALQAHEDIDAAVVTACVAATGDKELVAYLVAKRALNVLELQSYLAGLLPAFMVPYHYVQLASFPLTPNGKLDRHKLPDPAGLGLFTGLTYVAPRNTTEEKLAAIWEEVLGKERISVKDNFFTLGGHSLKITRLSSQIHKVFDVKIALKELFSKATLEEQAELITHTIKSAYVVIPRIAEQPDYLLSSSQRRLWVVSHFGEGNVAYNVPGVYVFEGTLDRQALESSFDTLITRHENLRTVFRENAAGDIRQIILSDAGFKISYQDLRHEQQQKEVVENLVKAVAIRPFDLAAGPLLRVELYQVANNKWVFAYAMHHIISDGWSMEILIREILQLYNAYAKGEQHTLAPLNIQYRDYVDWQHRQLAGDTDNIHRTYWLKQFEGELPVLELPADHVRPAIKTYNGKLAYRRIDTAVSERLSLLVKEQGATLFMGLTAAVTALLYKYTAQEDIVIGTPLAGREHADLENQIGFYVNTLALRLRFSGADNYKQLLAIVKEQTLGAYEHQIFPFDELVDGLHLQHDMSRNPLFDVQVILDHHEATNVKEVQRLHNLAVSGYEGEILETARFDMVFNFVETGAGIQATIQYNSDIYNGDSVERLFAHLDQLLTAIAVTPDVSINELAYLSTEDKQQLLVDFNSATAIYNKSKTVLDLFNEQVHHYPDSTALVYENTHLTYRELDEKSSQLAGYLITEYAVKADDLIGVMLDRSEKMIIAIMGILKAGAAYVPIDPEYPADRKKYIIKDTAAKVLITQTDYLFDLSDYEGAIFAIDIQLDTIESVILLPVVQPSQLAYIIYTSGSTGQPKGVLIEHGNLMHSTVPRILTYGRTDVFLLLSSIAFDSSVAGIFGTLCTGGTLCITSKMDPGYIAAYLLTNKISHLLTVPSYYRLLLAELGNKTNYLQAVIVAGEACSTQLVNMHFHTLADCAFYNEYGPTEGAVWSSVYQYNRHETPVQSIGKPIRNVYLYILNYTDDLVPVGVTGEICIAGAGLARGYLNQPALTAEKFVLNPFRKGEKMYRTGDLGKWLPDGNIEFLGRKDEQVKINGYRIELGEIENAILSHPEIEAAIVIAKSNKDESRELVAYIVSTTTSNTADIRSWLSKQLPAYMVPLHFVQLDEMPLTPNGKIDRKGLPEPDGLGMGSGVAYVAPRNETEEKMALIWQEILGKERIGIKDSFFALGGDSIRILKMMSELRKQLHIEVPIADIYAHHTIEALLHHINSNKTTIDDRNRNLKEAETQVKEEIFALKSRILSQENIPDKENIEDLYPMSDIEKGMVFESLLQHGIYHDQMINRRVFVDFDIQRFRKAMALLVEKHPILRTCFNVSDYETQIQIVYKKVPVAVHYKDLSESLFEEQEQVVRTFVQSELDDPFDVTKAPLWRMAAFNLGQDNMLFVSQCHHAIIDGWSDAIMLTELNNLYLQLGEDPLYKPTALKSTYKDFIIQHEVDKRNDAIRNFWQQELADYKRLDIFTTEDTFDAYSHDLDEDSFIALGKLAKDLQTTVRTISLSVYLYLLKVLNYEDEILAGLVTNTRPGIEDGDKILGCFLNTIPFRMMISDTMLCRELIAAVHEKTVLMKGNDRLSLQEITRLQQRQPDAGNPFFDTFFNFVDFHGYNAIKEDAVQSPVTEMDVQGNGSTNTFLDFTVNTTGNLYSIGFSLRKKLKSGFSAKQFGALYCKILKGIISNPDALTGELDLLDTEEQYQLLQTFNDTGAEYSDSATLIDLFESQAAKTPDSIALVFRGVTLSYQALNERANRLGHYLRRKYDIHPDDLVGIKLERSEWLIISILGVLKSGGAYVPVDPDYPSERISYIQEDSQCKAFIDEQLLAQFIQEETGYAGSNPEKININTDLAYVIYTSGSTGKPKGCMLEHRGIVNRIEWMWDHYGFNASDVILQKTTFTFDVSVWEIFMPLCMGAKMVLCDKADVGSPERILSLISTHRITCVHFVPGMLNVFIGSDPAADQLKSLRMVVTSGEALSKETVKNWYQLAAVPLHNLYGPTEASIEVTHYSVSAADTQILIGQPIRNIQIYITGKCGQLSRVGIAGEICIGGVGVARGYLNKAALTAAHFVDNPFGEGKLYKTGDLGKWLPDGNIAFLGRKDEQVKIRGYRIEPGEIEAVLQGYETIESAVVLARANEEGEKELVAYVVAKETLNSTEIRSFMSKRLPAYMVPGHFVQLSVFPLTASGKVDRKRLPDPGSNGMETDTAYRAPGNEREQQLLVVWQEILGKEKIGTRDNFFELGGHSLSVIKMVRILNKKYGILLKIQDIYNHPTIEALAAREQENSTMFRLSIHNNPAKRNIYFIPPVIGNAVMFMPLSDHLRDLFNCYGFQYKGLEKDEALHLSVENMAQEFSDEIIRQQTDEEFLIVGYSMGVPIAFEMIRILEQQFSKVKLMLVDRGVSDRHAGAHTANTLRNDVEWLAERYKEQVSAEHTDEAALTRFLTNNVQVLGKYRQSGVIKSNIHTFECAGNKVNTCMGEWNKYTVGEASHHWLNGGHWDAFSRENLPRFKQVITDIFREN